MIKPHKSTLLALAFLSVYSIAFSENPSYDELEGAEIRVYKRIDDFDLKLNILYPEGYKKGKKLPAVVFFFGGGWSNGDVHQFEPQCHYLASKGLIAITANYRVSSRNNSTPFDAVEDAKSAIRFIRENANELGVKKNKIVAAGGSAGGHLAAATATIPGYDAPGENLKVSSAPNALVLYNPVINTMEDGFGYKHIGENQETISPVDHVTPKLPPTLIFHGLEDNTVPYKNIEEFKAKMDAAGNTCYVVPFREMGHGFFNYGRNDNRCYELTMEKTQSFLLELHFIKF